MCWKEERETLLESVLASEREDVPVEEKATEPIEESVLEREDDRELIHV
jgi:hypothetical protein